jgi:hypothetical protein
MEFQFIDYKIFKTKKMLKRAKLLFIFHNTRLKSKNWLFVEQALKIIELSYYKVYNKSANMILKNSIFKNNNKLIINGTTILSIIDQSFFENKKKNSLILTTKLMVTHELLTFLFTKINNKLYSNYQTQKIKIKKHKTNISILCFLIQQTLKKKIIYYLGTKNFLNKITLK